MVHQNLYESDLFSFDTHATVVVVVVVVYNMLLLLFIINSRLSCSLS